MKNSSILDKKFDFFSSKRFGDVVILKFEGNMLLRTIDLSFKDTVLNYLDTISKIDSIKVVVLISSPEKTEHDEYLAFFHQALKSKPEQTAFHRMYNAIDQLILKIVKLNKIVVHANSGKVIPLFLNVSLACDYRIIADNTIFQNFDLELGMIPKGGGAFFLSKMLGLSKAYEILLSSKNITASEAMELGIVDKVVPLEELEEAALGIAQRFGKKPLHSLSSIKRLLNYSMKDLESYLETENQELFRTVISSEFREKLLEYR